MSSQKKLEKKKKKAKARAVKRRERKANAEKPKQVFMTGKIHPDIGTGFP